MKANIDLTTNRDFQEHNNSVFSPFHPSPYPHLPISKDLEHIIRYEVDKMGIYQGDKNERASKRHSDEFCDYITCDCCGRTLFCYNQSTLCPSCDEPYRLPQWFHN